MGAAPGGCRAAVGFRRPAAAPHSRRIRCDHRRVLRPSDASIARCFDAAARRRLCGSLLALIVLAVGAAPASAAVPRIKARAAKAVEGDGAATTVKVRVRLSARASAKVTARFRTVPGTAGAGDFTARSGKLRVRRGSRRATIRVRIAGDAVDEPDERFKVRLSSPRGARLSRPRATRVTIVDDDPAVMTLADASLTEPRSAGDVASPGLVLRLGAPAGEEVRVDYELVAGTAGAADGDLPRGTATIPAGESQSALPGVVRGDALDEATETITVLLRNPVGAQLPDPGATVTIADDPGDVPPSVSIGDVTRAEDVVGAAVVPVTLSAPSGRAVRVGYATQDGTADGADHAAVSGTLTFAPGVSTASVAAPITDDDRDEDAQAFAVRLTQADFATLADTEGAVTITDDDAPPSIAINDVSRAESAGIAPFTLTLSATGGAGCVANIDFLTLSNLNVTFSPLVVSRIINIGICNDAAPEPAESAAVLLTQPANVTIGDAAGALTIQASD